MADLGKLYPGTLDAANTTTDGVVGTQPVLDDPIGTPGDSSYTHTNNNTSTTEISVFDLDNTPSDLDSMDTIYAELRYWRDVNGPDKSWDSLRVQIFASYGGTALTNEITIASSITTTTATDSNPVQFTIQGTPTKGQWDGAVVVITFYKTKNMGGESDDFRVSTCEITGTYTAVGGYDETGRIAAVELGVASSDFLNGAATEDLIVLASGDDGYNDSATTITATYARSYVGDETFDVGNWIRFLNVEIPKDASISSATLTVYVTRNYADADFDARIYGNAEDDVSNPTTYTDLYTTKVKTTAYVDTTIPNTAPLDTDFAFDDISTVIEEIVGRPNWESGDPLMLLMFNVDATGGDEIGWDAYDNSTTTCARLSIDYVLGESYDETGRSAATNVSTASTDEAAFDDTALAVDTNLATANTDLQAMTEASSAAINLATASTDGQGYLDAALAAIQLATASTDSQGYPEAATSAIEIATTSTDLAASVDTATAAIELQVDSTDVYTGGGTEYDETGRSAAIQLATASTDLAAFLETSTAAIELATASTDLAASTDAATANLNVSTASTDSQSMVENLAASVELSTAQTDLMAATDAGTAAIELGTASNDSQGYPESASADVQLGVSNSATASFTNALTASVELQTSSTDVYTPAAGEYDETGRSAAIEVSTASTDLAAFVDTTTADVNVATSSSDSQGMVETSVAAVEVATSHIDGQGYADTGSAAVELSTTSNDLQGFVDTGTAATELGTSNTNLFAGLDVATAAVELGVDSSDVHTSGGYDETGRSAAIEIGTTSSSVAAWIDTLAASIELEVSSTDSHVRPAFNEYVEYLAVAVQLSTSSSNSETGIFTPSIGLEPPSAVGGTLVTAGVDSGGGIPSVIGSGGVPSVDYDE